MRVLGGVVALVLTLVLCAGCTTHTERSVRDDESMADRIARLQATQLSPYLPPLTVAPRATTYLHGWPVGAGGNVLRIGLDGVAASRAGWFSFGADGRVTRVADRSVYIDRRDLKEWRISPVQLATVLGALDALGVRAAEAGDFGPAWATGSAPSGSVSWGVEHPFVIEGSDERFLNTLYAVTEPPAHGVRRSVPTAIELLAGRPDRTARSPLTAKDPFAPWPLAEGIRELATGTAPNAYGEEKLALCLVGRDAARVWRRLFTGVNTAYLRVDDGRRWELNARVGLPGYPEFAESCLPG